MLSLPSPTPLAFFADVLWSRESTQDSNTRCRVTAEDSSQKTCEVPVICASSIAESPKVKDSPIKYSVDTWQRGDPADNTTDRRTALKTELSRKLKAMKFLGRFIAACIADSMYVNLQLSKPFIKQVRI